MDYGLREDENLYLFLYLYNLYLLMPHIKALGYNPKDL